MFHLKRFVIFVAGISAIGLLITWALLQLELNTETKRSLGLRIEAATRIASQNFAAMGVRGLVETFGAEIAEDRISIMHGGVIDFETGRRSLFSICAVRELKNFFPLRPQERHTSDPYRIEVCRRAPVSTFAPLALLLLVVGFILLSLKFSKNAENAAVKTFNRFLLDQKLNLTPLKQLDDIFSVLGNLDKQLRANELASRKIEREKALNDMAAQFVHDISPWMSTLRLVSSRLNSDEVSAELIVELLRNMTNKRKQFLDYKSNIENGHVPGIDSLSLEEIFEILQKNISAIFQKHAGSSEGLTIVRANEAGFSKEDRYIAKEQDLVAIFENILSNAFDAKKITQKSPEIEVKVARGSKDVTIFFSDAGVGIDEHLLEKLFVQGATFAKEGGTGYGLWGVRKTIEEWGGSVSIDSELGRGAVVKLVLRAIK